MQETVLAFQTRALCALGGLPVRKRKILDIRESLDRFTPPDFMYKAYPNEYTHLDEALTDQEALEITLSLVHHVMRTPVGTQLAILASEISNMPILLLLEKCMVGLWLEHERIPKELLAKSHRYLSKVAVQIK
jgi:hypothetical protein